MYSSTRKIRIFFGGYISYGGGHSLNKNREGVVFPLRGSGVCLVNQ